MLEVNGEKVIEQPKVGVGICTRNRPKYLSRLLMKLIQYRNEGPIRYDIFVADDGSEDEAQKHLLEQLKDIETKRSEEPRVADMTTNFGTLDCERVGVAKNKNRILRHFADSCDYVAMLEDDIYPTKADWLAVHIEALNVLNIHHLAFWCHNKPEHGGKLLNVQQFQLANGKVLHLAQTTKIMGTFLLYSRKVWESVGGFDRRFGLWGCEHVEYSDRIKDHRIALAPPFGYPSLLECEDYICWEADNPPSIIPAEEKEGLLKEQQAIWDKIREEYFLFRPF